MSALQEAGRLADQHVAALLERRIAALETRLARYEANFSPAPEYPAAWGLTVPETKLLRFLESASPHFQSPKRILAVVCPESDKVNNIVVAVSRLRKKIEPHGIEIESQYRIGYGLTEAMRERLAALRAAP